MTDFIARLHQGIKAHEENEVRRSEIKSVLGELNNQIESATNGKLNVFIQEFSEKKKKKASSLTELVNPFDFSNVETIKYMGLAVGDKNHNHAQMLAKWFESTAVYPITLEYDDLSIDAFSKQDLEMALGDLLASPTTGRSISRLVASKLDSDFDWSKLDDGNTTEET